MASSINYTLFMGFLQTAALQNDMGLALVELLKFIKAERYYDTLIYMDHGDLLGTQTMQLDDISKNLVYPMMQLKGNTSYFLWPNFNREFLALVPISGEEFKDQELLQTLWKTLRRIRRTRLLLIFKEDQDDDYLNSVVEFCCDNKAVNILAVRETFMETSALYMPQIYPKFRMTTKVFTSGTLYLDPVRNMHRSPLRLGINKESQKAFVARKVGDEYILGGNVGLFFGAFVKARNATITFPHYNYSDEMSMVTLEKFVANGTYDMSMEPYYNLYVSDVIYSDILDFMDWCIMVPMEEAIPAYLFYARIFDLIVIATICGTGLILAIFVALTFLLEGASVSLLDVFFNIKIFNGMLGQSFSMETHFTGVRSILYVLTCLGGLIVNTTFVTYLQTFNAHPPTFKAVSSVADLRSSGLKLAIYKEEYLMLKANMDAAEYEPVVKAISSYKEYFKLRDSYDSRYAYPVPSAQWTQYEEQQKFFSKPRFRLTDMCFVKMVGFMIPMQPNSIFEEAVNTMIGQVNQAGLVLQWKTMAFLEAVQSKRLTLIDASRVEAFEPLTLEDTILLDCLFLLMISIAFLCFIGELYWPRRGFLLKRIWRRINY
ncbi:uncharacterized protein LOC106091637 [Stomoxys calcitrans]|uniref:uncharacterized protein LOC106091637 n=1 Tax=Stomoxys calcitrans TaxID=35570 RepID=UPI0027E2C21B|nr:uncharacterized protein LOC106091637 [Stomoxys calcitrans]